MSDKAKAYRVVGIDLDIDGRTSSQLAAFVKEQDIQVAVLAVPENAAAGILDQLAAAGVQGVLNFSPVQLKAGSALFVQNINIAFEIENLFYYVRFNQRKDLPAAP